MNKPINIKKSSDEWKEISRWCEERLAEYRLKLESENVPAGDVPGLRGRIAALKALLTSTAEDHRNVIQ